jgi:hypothetical protein
MDVFVHEPTLDWEQYAAKVSEKMLVVEGGASQQGSVPSWDTLGSVAQFAYNKVRGGTKGGNLMARGCSGHGPTKRVPGCG